LGVGLMVVQVVQVVVRSHGGSDVAHSAGADRGSQFGVTLPMAAVGPIAPAERAATDDKARTR
jgi:hypothetical protein